eukprot:TRINITY_DN10884_c0_g1_i1.p1 TRINITY_DN10884_c0_g1~~TRINITY_DN10884_c0_g1_i1.p1  ORF type:complete len:367 (+),score=56.75 TRINITY_DN10884_c0_g1_i1:61-1101(+)
MRALVKAKPQPGLWLQEVPVPGISPDDVLIKVHRTAICGTDLHIFNWDKWSQQTIPWPMTIGHEFYGRIAKVGDNVKGLAVGDRVSGEGHITCGYCRNCRAGRRHLCRNTVGLGVNRPGCFADYVSLPASNAFKLSDKISDQVASVLDPIGNATHTALAFNMIGEDVLITGAGPIGCIATAICKHVGARNVVITDVNQYRLDIAKKMGATVALNVAGKDNTTMLKNVMHDLNMKEGFDVGLEMSGFPAAFDAMFATMNHGGSAAILGIPSDRLSINWSDVIFKGLTIRGIYGREMYETWYKMTQMIEGGLDVSPIFTHTLTVPEFEGAFSLIKQGNVGKVVIDWTK